MPEKKDASTSTRRSISDQKRDSDTDEYFSAQSSIKSLEETEPKKPEPKKPERQSVPQPETQPETQAEPEPEPQPKRRSQLQSEPQAEPQPEPQSEPQSEYQLEPLPWRTSLSKNQPRFHQVTRGSDPAADTLSISPSIFGEDQRLQFEPENRRPTRTWPPSGCIHIPLRPNTRNSDFGVPNVDSNSSIASGKG